MTTLLLAEHDNKSLNEATRKALTAAKALGAPVHVLVAGQGAQAVADAAAKLDGVEKVLLADDAALGHHLAEPLAALIVSLAGGYDASMSRALLSETLPARFGHGDICRTGKFGPELTFGTSASRQPADAKRSSSRRWPLADVRKVCFRASY